MLPTRSVLDRVVGVIAITVGLSTVGLVLVWCRRGRSVGMGMSMSVAECGVVRFASPVKGGTDGRSTTTQGRVVRLRLDLGVQDLGRRGGSTNSDLF